MTGIKGNEATRGMRSSVSHFDWISRVGGRLHLNFLSIPGSHDTMSYQSEKTDLMGMVLCQDKNLYEQMSLGIRFSDIRLSFFVSWTLFLKKFPPQCTEYDETVPTETSN